MMSCHVRPCDIITPVYRFDKSFRIEKTGNPVARFLYEALSPAIHVILTAPVQTKTQETQEAASFYCVQTERAESMSNGSVWYKWLMYEYLVNKSNARFRLSQSRRNVKRLRDILLTEQTSPQYGHKWQPLLRQVWGSYPS